MTNRRLRSMLSGLMVLVYAVVGIGAAHVERLCIGSDGHFVLEGFSGEGDCHLESGADADADSLGRPVSDRDCVDYQLPGRTVLKASDDGKTFVAFGPILTFLFYPTIAPELATDSLAPADGSRAQGALALLSLRTVILLL